MTRRLLQNYIPIHYDLYIHIVESQISFDASVTITVQKNQEDTKFELNLGPNIVIKKVTQNEINLNYNVDYPFLTIEKSTSPEMDFDSHPITIEYTVTPTDADNEGFFICNGNYLTDFEPTGARQLLPCFDEPCVRSTFSIKLLIPSYLTAVSNMPIETIKPMGGENELTFLRTHSMCTYLICLCIGSYSSIVGTTNNGTMVEIFTKTGKEEMMRQYLDVAIYSLNWLETKFGVKYELPSLQLISLYGFPGGMENYGLITLNDYTHSNNILYNISVIMHEITHQWFGDLVCIKYWDSLWLNEGFAEFIQYLILRDYKPDMNVFKYFVQSDGFCCFRYFNKGVIVPNENEINFDHLFDSLVYSKGAFVLKMFFDLVGEESFVKVCSNYLNTFKNKCADVKNFIEIVNSSLNKDFAPFFDPWLRNVGFPVLSVNEIWNGSQKVGLTISQICQTECLYYLNVQLLYEKNGVTQTKNIVIDDFLIQVDLDFDWVIVNNEVGSLCYVIYSINLLDDLQKPKMEGKISLANAMLIKQSAVNGLVGDLINDEIVDMANSF